MYDITVSVYRKSRDRGAERRGFLGLLLEGGRKDPIVEVGVVDHDAIDSIDASKPDAFGQGNQACISEAWVPRRSDHELGHVTIRLDLSLDTGRGGKRRPETSQSRRRRQ